MIEQYTAIVGLVSAFSSGRGSQNALNIADFQVWLAEHNHEEVVQQLSTNVQTQIFVKAYLNRQLPEIQSKLDFIINLVGSLASEPLMDESVFSGKHYLKGVVLLGIERIIESGLHSEDFDIAHSYVCELIGESIYYNRYVLEKIIRDSLLRNQTASHILNLYWLDLVRK